MELSQKQKTFLNFFFDFLNLYQILNILQKRMTLIAVVFVELADPKNMIK